MIRFRKRLWPAFVALALCAGLFPAGCRRAAEPAPEVIVHHEIIPQPPRTGSVTITISMTDALGKPVSGASVSLEGNMSHPGMRPTFGKAQEVAMGRYQAPLEFTMGGDWVVIVHVALPNGQKLERQFDVKSVQAN